MVFLRAAAWAWLGVLPVVWCLPLEGVRSLPQHQQQEPVSSLLEDLSAASNIQPQDYSQDEYQQFLPRQPEASSSLNSYDGSEGLPYAYRLQDGLAGAGLAAPGAADDVKTMETPPELLAVDPRYYLLAHYLGDHPEEALGSDSSSSSNLTPVRKIRNSSNGSSSSSISNKNSNSALDSSSSSSMAKRTWPHGFTRRRTSGLSLSIDASMKVLREALYLEMARKKQRQQMLRARHNQALLTTIGKRDVQRQLLQEEEESHVPASLADAAAPASLGHDRHLRSERM